MKTNTSSHWHNATLAPTVDECLMKAFPILRAEAIPDRFRVLLDALGQVPSAKDQPDDPPAR